MRKRWFGFSALLGVLLFGDQSGVCLHNLLLDGQKVDTVWVGQPFLFSFDLEKVGGQAGVEIWMDLDGNRQIEPETDFLVISGEGMFKDGGPGDQDSSEDSFFKQVIGENWPLPTGFILRAWEAGVSDSAYLLQIPVNSGYSVSGMVVNPPEKERLVIYAALGKGKFPSQEVTYAAFTDRNGDYQIWVPESLGVQNWLIGSVDIIGTALGYIPPEPVSVLVDGEITGVNLAYQEATAWVQGRVMAQDGEGIPGMRVNAELEGGLKPSTLSDSLGDYLLPLKEGRWVIDLEASDLIPEYLVPESRKIKVNQGDTCHLDLVCFQAKEAVSGTVYTDLGGLPGIEVEGWFDLGWSTARTDTLGVYTLWVADFSGGYSLKVNPPEGYYVEKGQTDGILAGEQGANFHLLWAESFLQGWVYDHKGGVLPGSDIFAWGQKGSFFSQTDSKGYYRIYAPLGSYTLRAQKEGYQVQTLRGVDLSQKIFTKDFYLKYLPGLVSGYIYSLDGPPLRAAWISAVDSPSGDSFYVATDWSGFYQLRIPYTNFSLTAGACGYEGQREEMIALNPSHPDTEINFYLRPLGEKKMSGKSHHFLLFPNYPNIFNEVTPIRFFLEGNRHRLVTGGIYNVKGERVKLLFNHFLPPGFHQFAWGGTDEEGENAKSGLYFLSLDTGGDKLVKKFLLIR